MVAIRSDSRSLADTERLVELVGERFGTLDALFLNAGTFRASPLEALDEALYDELFDVNAEGQRLAPVLADGASVVVTVGVAAARGIPGAAVGAGSRGALLAMVPSLAVEFAPRGIRLAAS